jgi:signal transduction histidine kinase
MKIFLLLITHGVIASNLLGYQITHLNNKNDLSNDHIKGIAFDKFNYLWIGTENGLNQYNGYSTKRYNISKILKSNLYEDRTVSVIPYKDGSVIIPVMYQNFVKAIGNQLQETKSSVFELFPHHKKIKETNVEVYISSLKNRLALNNGLYIKFDQKTASIIKDDFTLIADLPAPDKKLNLKDSVYQQHCFSIKGNVYCIDESLNLYILSDLKWKFKCQLIHKTDLKPNQFNNIRAIGSYDTDYAILQINQKLCIAQLNEKSEPEINCIIDHFSVENPIYSIYKKELNLLVIGTLDDGVYIYKGIQNNESQPRFIKTFSELYLLPIGKDTIVNGNLDMYSISTGKALGKYNYINSYALRVACVDHFNRVWYWNDDNKNIYLINENKPSATPIKINDQKKIMKGLFEDSKHRIWLLKEDFGLTVYDNNSKISNPIIKNFEHHGMSVAICEQDEYLYVLCNPNILLKINGNTLKYRKYKISKSEYRIRSFYPIGKDSFLITTYGNGLFVLTPKLFIPLPLDKNKSLSFSHTINTVTKDILLISSNDGLICVKISEIKSYLKSKSKIHYMLYNWFGDYKSEFNGGVFPCSFVSSGKFIFPHTQGIAIFDSSYFTDRKSYLKTFNIESISDIRNNQELKLFSLIKTESNPLLEFKLSLPFWGNFNNLDIEVSIKNGTKTIVKNFNNLDFEIDNLKCGLNEVSIKLSDGKDMLIQDFTINIARDWFECWYNYVIIVIVLTVLFLIGLKIYFIYLNVKNRRLMRLVYEQTKIIEQDKFQLFQKNIELENSNQFKDRIVSIITHDLLGPLRFSSKALSTLKEKLNDAQDQFLLKEIQKTNENVLTHSNEILTWYKLNDSSYTTKIIEIELHSFIDAIFSIHKPKAIDREFKNLIKIDSIIRSDRVILKTIFSNLIENAIKYGTGKIEVKANFNSEFTDIIFLNEGAKISQKLRKALNNEDFMTAFNLLEGKTKGGYGLKLCFDLIKLIGGKIQFADSPENSNIVIVTLKSNETINK